MQNELAVSCRYNLPLNGDGIFLSKRNPGPRQDAKESTAARSLSTNTTNRRTSDQEPRQEIMVFFHVSVGLLNISPIL